MSATAAITREEAFARLAAIAGSENAQLSAEIIRVSPADAQQISAILRFANECGLSVVPTTGGTKLAWGNPVAPEIDLSLARLNLVTEHAWQDLTCTVQAGCIWDEMQTRLALHGQMVALDPLWPHRATVGGVVAANESGALRLRYGGLRDLVIGMTIVLSDGTIAKTGGKVVKNVAGYDLHKLLTGSFGTLGIITEVNFRLHPVEQHARTFTAIAPDPAQLAQPLANLLRAQISPSAVQLRIDGSQCALDTRLCARPECLSDHAAQLQQIFGSLPMSEANESVWLARENLFAHPAASIVKASMLPAEIGSIAADCRQNAAALGLEISLVAQATGLATIALSGPPQVILSAVNRLRTRLFSSGGGSAVILQPPADLRGKLDPWDCHSDALPLMREIKRRFDPNRILSPGRFVGGI